MCVFKKKNNQSDTGCMYELHDFSFIDKDKEQMKSKKLLSGQKTQLPSLAKEAMLDTEQN